MATQEQDQQSEMGTGEPRTAQTIEGAILDDVLEVCPICRGNGFISRSGDKDLFTVSESTLSSVRSSRGRMSARHPRLHLPSLNEGDDLEPTCSTTSRKSTSTKAEESVRRAVLKLSSLEWDVKREGLQECLLLAERHPEEVNVHMNPIYRAMRFLVTNHRSKDTLFVCQIARKYFPLLRSTVRPEFDELVIALLARSADSSLKVRCYVKDALDKMVTYLPLYSALRPLAEKGCTHQNPLVRTATVKLLSDIVTFRTPTALFSYPFMKDSCKKIIEIGAKMLVDNNSGTRAAAKVMFLKFVNRKEFQEVYDSCGFDNELRTRIDRIIASLKDPREEDI